MREEERIGSGLNQSVKATNLVGFRLKKGWLRMTTCSWTSLKRMWTSSRSNNLLAICSKPHRRQTRRAFTKTSSGTNSLKINLSWFRLRSFETMSKLFLNNSIRFSPHPKLRGLDSRELMRSFSSTRWVRPRVRWWRPPTRCKWHRWPRCCLRISRSSA